MAWACTYTTCTRCIHMTCTLQHVLLHTRACLRACKRRNSGANGAAHMRLDVRVCMLCLRTCSV